MSKQTRADVLDSTSPSLKIVLIVGSGLLGTSIGLALKQKNIEVFLDDVNEESVRIASDLGAGKQFEDSLHIKPDVIIIATAPQATAGLVHDALKKYESAVVVDICSVKKPISDLLISSYVLGEKELSRYVGTHPMAGREKSGAIYAQKEFFIDKPWIIVPLEKDQKIISSSDAINVAQKLALDCGASYVFMDASEHDRAMAQISHVPQVLSSVLAKNLDEINDRALALSGNGLRDMIRIANSDSNMWSQIFASNSQEISFALKDIYYDLGNFIEILDQDQESIKKVSSQQLVKQGNSGYKRVPGKHGVVPAPFASIQVIIDDSPGQLSSLFYDIDQLGINVEDLHMEHAPNKESGVIEVSVVPDKVRELVEGLRSETEGSKSWSVVF